MINNEVATLIDSEVVNMIDAPSNLVAKYEA